MNLDIARGYIAYTLEVMGYSDDLKIDILGRVKGLVELLYPSKACQKDNMQANISEEECKSIASQALAINGFESDIQEFNTELENSFNSYSKESAREYYVMDKFLTYEYDEELEVLFDDEGDFND